MTLPADDLRCTHVNARHHRCRNPRATGSERCLFHIKQPFRAEIRREPVRSTDALHTAAGIHDFLARTLERLAAGAIAPSRATALCYVAQTMLNSLARAREEQVALHPPDPRAEEAMLESVIVKASLENLLTLHQQANADDNDTLEIVRPDPPKDAAA